MPDLTRRELLVDAQLGAAMYGMSPGDIDLDAGESLAAWVARQKASGESAYSTAKELDLLCVVTISFQLVEHYDDGTRKCVERVEWTDG